MLILSCIVFFNVFEHCADVGIGHRPTILFIADDGSISCPFRYGKSTAIVILQMVQRRYCLLIHGLQNKQNRLPQCSTKIIDMQKFWIFLSIRCFDTLKMHYAIWIFWCTVCSRCDCTQCPYIQKYRTMKDSGPFAAPSFMFVGRAKARWREDEKLISDSDQI